MIDLDKAATELKDLRLVDNGALLKPGGRREMLDAMDRWKDDYGLTAYVLLRPTGEPLEDWRPLWGKIGLNDTTDLLLVFNARRWEARGWGLSFAETSQALQSAESALHEYYGKGLVRAIDALGDASLRKRGQAPHRTGLSTSTYVGGGIGAALVVGVVALVVHRRGKVAKDARGAFDAARASAEKAYSEVTLGAEELGTEDASQLQLRAAELKKRLDAVVEDAQKSAKAMSDPVTLGKVRQLENELAALRSTSLQKGKKS